MTIFLLSIHWKFQQWETIFRLKEMWKKIFIIITEWLFKIIILTLCDTNIHICTYIKYMNLIRRIKKLIINKHLQLLSWYNIFCKLMCSFLMDMCANVAATCVVHTYMYTHKYVYIYVNMYLYIYQISLYACIECTESVHLRPGRKKYCNKSY